MAVVDRTYDERGEVPLGGYATLAATFATGAAAFTVAVSSQGVRPP